MLAVGRPGRLGRRVPLGHRERVGPHDDRVGGHAGHGQARQQHLGHVPGLPGGRIVPLPRLRRGWHRLRPGQVGGGVPLGEPHVRGQAGGDPADPRLPRGAGDLRACASPRRFSTRRSNSGAKGSAAPPSRASCRSTSIRLPGTLHPDVLALRRVVLRDDDPDQPLREVLPQPQAAVRGEPGHLVRGRGKFADIVLPACTNFERWDISEFASCSGYIPDSYTQTNNRVFTLQKKCIEPLGESKSDYEIFAAVCDRLGVGDLFTMGGKDEYQWTKEYFHATDLPKYDQLGRVREEGLLRPALPRRTTSPPRPCAGSPRTGCATRRTGAPPPPTPSVSKACRPRRARSSSCPAASQRFEAGGNLDPERPAMGPQFIPSWEGHRTTGIGRESTRCSWSRPTRGSASTPWATARTAG